jgi:UV DNA damage endonuclease
MTTKRIGFACKFVHKTAKGAESIPELNTRGTTMRWLREHQQQAEDKQWELMRHNIESLRLLVQRVGSLDPQLRMVRLSSDILGGYTEPNWRDFWRRTDVVAYAERHFARVGELARQLDVRLSFHPGQFCVLASDREDVVNRSIEEFEYHADMARWMGFAKKPLDFKINIHLSGKRGIKGFCEAYNQLSPEARNTITIENDEFQAGLDEILPLRDKVGIVLDLHHHWIRTGEYINASDPRIQMIIESWCRDGVNRRPVVHLSQSSELLFKDHSKIHRPNLKTLLENGHKKSKLRAHSAAMWNTAINEWAKQHWEYGDIMVESKLKNIASRELSSQWITS